MTTIFALLGVKALYLLYSWLLAAILGSYLSGRKGYGERPGLASGLLLNLIGPLIWLFVPARQDSLWKKVGPWGRGGSKKRREQIKQESAPAAGGAGPDAAP